MRQRAAPHGQERLLNDLIRVRRPVEQAPLTAGIGDYLTQNTLFHTIITHHCATPYSSRNGECLWLMFAHTWCGVRVVSGTRT